MAPFGMFLQASTHRHFENPTPWFKLFAAIQFILIIMVQMVQVQAFKSWADTGNCVQISVRGCNEYVQASTWMRNNHGTTVLQGWELVFR